MRNRSVPILLLVLAVPGTVMAQSANGTYMVMQETVTSGGGEIGGGNPMKAQTALGLPAGGAASNSTYALIGGMATSTGPQTISMEIPVTGTIDEPTATVRVNGVAAVVSETTWTADGVRLSLGPNLLTATATDALGNQRQHTIRVYLDVSAAQKTPRFNITVAGTINDNAATVDVNGVAATVASGQFTASVPLVTGHNPITATARDALGNQSVKSIAVFVPPAQPPPMPTVGTTGPPIPRVTTQSSLTIGGTKTAGTSIWINGQQVVAADNNTTWAATLSLVEGDNDLIIVAKNADGTSSAEVHRTIIVDNLKPVVTFAPPAKTNFNPVPLTGSVDDSDTIVTINGIAATRTKRAFDISVPLTLGTNNLHLVATSPNGYVTTKDDVITLGTIPSIQTSQPADGAKAYAGTAATLQVTAQDQEGDPIQYQFLIDGIPLTDWSAASSQTWTPPAGLSGVRTVTVKVRDDYGGSNQKDVEVFVVRPPINHP